MTVNICVGGRHEADIRIVYVLVDGTACARVGGDLRLINHIVHEMQAIRGLTPNDGLDFLQALLWSYPESTASFYGAPTAILAA